MTHKVAIVEPVGGHGGMDYYDFGLCAALVASGVEVTLHTCDKTILPKSPSFGIHLDYRGVYGTAPLWKRALRYALGTLRALWYACRKGIPLCHFHFFRMGGLETFNVLCARLLGRKVVATIHDVESFSYEGNRRVMTRLIVWLVNRFIVHNQVSRDELMRVAGVRDSKIAVIPHGNYLAMRGEYIPSQLARQRLGLPADAKILLFFGQIKEVKGLDILLSALPRVITAHPETVLVIAGRPWKTGFENYASQIDKLGIRSHCHCHIRYIPDEEVPVFYSAADLVVLPYRRIYQSGVVLMAMSYGKPVLASDLRGMQEVVTDGETGFLFKSGDPEDLSLRLIHLLGRTEHLGKIAEQSERLMCEHYDWLTIGRKTAQCYAKVMS